MTTVSKKFLRNPTPRISRLPGFKIDDGETKRTSLTGGVVNQCPRTPHPAVSKLSSAQTHFRCSITHLVFTLTSRAESSCGGSSRTPAGTAKNVCYLLASRSRLL